MSYYLTTTWGKCDSQWVLSDAALGCRDEKSKEKLVTNQPWESGILWCSRGVAE